MVSSAWGDSDGGGAEYMVDSVVSDEVSPSNPGGDSPESSCWEGG